MLEAKNKYFDGLRTLLGAEIENGYTRKSNSASSNTLKTAIRVFSSISLRSFAKAPKLLVSEDATRNNSAGIFASTGLENDCIVGRSFSTTRSTTLFRMV